MANQRAVVKLSTVMRLPFLGQARQRRFVLAKLRSILKRKRPLCGSRPKTRHAAAHVSLFQALLRCHAIWIDCRNDDALSVGVITIQL